MWSATATQENAGVLRKRGVQLWGPGEGSQACGEMGEGRMLEPLDLAQRMAGFFGEGVLAGVKVLITAGPTREPIDPVRYITNRSSGRMGYAIAEACLAAGAEVTLVSGPVDLAAPAGATRISVETAAQMHDAVMARASSAQMFIATAAVADYRPESCADEKIKKQKSDLTLALSRTTDILADVAKRYPAVFTVGFAAETEKLQDYARAKLETKKLDMVAANWVSDGRAFDRDDNALWVCWPGGEKDLPAAPKKVLAVQLVQLIAERHDLKTKSTGLASRTAQDS
jgi:phosphopantothenoylcysteine decarboxylase/phosphopantothenate--cysteine ligase